MTEKDELRTLLDILDEMHPKMGEGPYMFAHATAHERFRKLSKEEQARARSHVRAHPQLTELISFP